ncbi:ADP-ribosylglycohydrolase family protein [Solirubrobacter soli]|uniref:ADP-ribosylglycohydrolase family protein n=1 Tax=Solirubrobacter soli TaxID=363832 RepID=UPI0003FF1D79|nr:ADP-ribosylglycohydrolase family protein [Solirubrobacter soli]
MIDRALGALYGLAIGDALGMPTQTFSRERIVARWGELRGFEPGPPDNEISAGMEAGRVTDDTDQALIVARALVRGGGTVDHRELADALLAWEREMVVRGSLDLLGPSTRRALDRFAAGDTEGAGRGGNTNGAAMRIAPVGIATRSRELLLARVAQVSRLTHDTPVAIAGASAVAGAVSAAIEGAMTPDALAAGRECVGGDLAASRECAGGDLAGRIERALALVAAGVGLDEVAARVGTGVATEESVPAAFAVAAAHPADPWAACLAAASLGGDTDTIAAMTGAIVGASRGLEAFPAEAVERVRDVNDLHLQALAEQLLELRG